MLPDQKARSRLRQLLTREKLIWLLIFGLIVLTAVVAVWASKQPNLSVDPGPPLS